jgi:hypothetical protein
MVSDRVATYFNRDVATFPHGLNRLLASGNTAHSDTRNNKEFEDIRRYVEYAILQA